MSSAEMLKAAYKILDKEVKLDILVISHNRIDLTIQCIDAIYKNTLQPFHLIVVDDSTDLTSLYLRQLDGEKDNVAIIHSDKQYENSYQVISDAIAFCKTPYMALVVNSVTVEPEWEIAALQVMKSNPTVGVIGFKQLHHNTGLIESAGMASTFGGSMLSDIGNNLPSHRLSKVYECEAVAWAFVLLRVEALKGNLGNCPYHGWKGWEEIDTCMVLRERGWKIFYCGLGVGYHQTRATRGLLDVSKEIIANETRLNLENREVFAKRWGYWQSYHKATQLEEYFPNIPALDKKMAFTTVAGVTRDVKSFQLAGVIP